MYATKSFCNVSAFISNEPGVNSAIGELNQHAATFSREVAIYRSGDVPGYGLINFSSRNEAVKEVMRQSAVDQAIAMVDAAVRTTIATAGELYQDEVHRLIVQVAETVGADFVVTGRMATNGRHWVPSFIQWHDTTDSRDNEHIVWLAVDDFINDYPDYEIIVVPPVDNLDSFFFPGSVVEASMREITPTQMIERAEAAKGEYPTTWRRNDPYTYHDPANSNRRIDVYWQILGYGDAGNDPDIIRDHMVDYILANSSHPREDWAVIFPDIFRRTELVFVPHWNKYAASARTFEHGIYSCIVNNGDPVKYAGLGAIGYPTAHVRDNVQTIGFPYRSLAISVVGHLENRDGKFKFSDHFPDYMNVPTTSTDAGRMSLETQAWIEKMLELIILAEEWTIATRMPRGIYRVVRGGKTFVSTTIDRVLMLVMVKSDVVEATLL